MTLARNFSLLASTCGLILALTSAVQAGSRVSKWDCPTGQMKNPLTAICEGPYEGLFIFSSPAYGDGWHTGYNTGTYWHNGHRYYRNHYQHSHN